MGDVGAWGEDGHGWWGKVVVVQVGRVVVILRWSGGVEDDEFFVVGFTVGMEIGYVADAVVAGGECGLEMGRTCIRAQWSSHSPQQI